MTFLKFKIWFTVIAPKSTMCKVSHTRPMGGIYSLNKEFQMFYMTLTLVAYTWKLHWRSLQTLYLKMGKLWASLNQGERKYCKVESLTWRKHWRIWRMILYISPNFYLLFKNTICIVTLLILFNFAHLNPLALCLAAPWSTSTGGPYWAPYTYLPVKH